VIEGTVSGADVVMGKRRSLVVRLQDGTGGSLRFYHFSNAQKEGLKRGTRALLRRSAARRFGAGNLPPGIPRHHRRRTAAGGQTLTPIYPLTEGLTQQRLRQLCMQTLTLLGPRSLPDWLPTELARDYQLAPLADAIRYLHTRRPTPMSTNSPSAITGPSTAWPSKNC
jgi:ATP-dependent DNA helicase RecG